MPDGGTKPRRAWRKIAAWTVAACVLGALFVYHTIWDSENVEQEFKPVPFTAYPGLESAHIFAGRIADRFCVERRSGFRIEGFRFICEGYR